MPDQIASFGNSVSFFRQAFILVFALALTEAFKQFVDDKAVAGEGETGKHFHWDRLPALVSFLFLIVPFFHGTVRYFYLTYESVKPFSFYSAYLMFDGLVFLIEAALFFAMSRSLALVRWRTFYWCIFWLVSLDSAWGVVAYTHGTPTLTWIILNLVLAVFLQWILGRYHGTANQFRASDGRITTEGWTAVMGAGAVIVRTVLDYGFSWNFYFG